MKLSVLNLKLYTVFIGFLFVDLSLELLLESFGAFGPFLPNFIMCTAFSFAFHRPVSFWLVSIAVIISESFFSSTPGLMAILITISYFFVAKILLKGGLRHRNFHILVFMLITMVIYSCKILWLYAIGLRPEVALIAIKMLVTIILFPLFYLATEKILILFKC